MIYCLCTADYRCCYNPFQKRNEEKDKIKMDQSQGRNEGEGQEAEEHDVNEEDAHEEVW